MTIKEYQEFTRTTAIYPKESAIVYCTLGLVNEAGEVAGKVKKVFRDHNSDFTDAEQLAKILSELGDVFWYAFRLADECGMDVEDILEQNKSKLQSRSDRGTLKGDGDNR